jgi:hypothetical protein
MRAQTASHRFADVEAEGQYPGRTTPTQEALRLRLPSDGDGVTFYIGIVALSLAIVFALPLCDLVGRAVTRLADRHEERRLQRLWARARADRWMTEDEDY